MKLLAINKFLELPLMINKNFFLKLPVNFNNKCKIYPPSINDIIGNENFPLYQKILTFSQEELEDEFDIEIPDRNIKDFRTVKDVLLFIEEQE